ncbi:MAG TPA: MBL fold metallo-hydrolase [Verrucomicrobiae bacterium]|jgi:L-ascorbate metabolism protein UlaG (beta-lactamase superfamily)|nr:MBL fold metallo-hydrolase [Verrucomicrobiae bacterium]
MPEHHIGKKFRNLEIASEPTIGDLFHWLFRHRPRPWPKRVKNKKFPPPPASVAPGELAVTFIGHSAFLLQFEHCAVLTDPMFSKRASPLRWAGPKRVRPPGLRLKNLPHIDLVLLSHDHYDHMDLRSLRRLRRAFNPAVVTGLRNGPLLKSLKLKTVFELDWWESCRVNDKATVTMTPAQHFSGRWLWGRDTTLWGGFVLEMEGWRIFFAGDTGYAKHFKEVGKRFPGVDLALLPIGAYEPLWFLKVEHMNPAEAVRAHLDVGAQQSIGMHFGTFHLTDEGIKEPVKWLGRARAEKGIAPEQFRTLEPGETAVYHRRGTEG